MRLAMGKRLKLDLATGWTIEIWTYADDQIEEVRLELTDPKPFYSTSMQAIISTEELQQLHEFIGSCLIEL